MNCFDLCYFKSVRLLLVIIGLWPFSDSTVKRIKRCFVCCFMFSCLVTQVSTWATEKGNLCQFIESIPYVTGQLAIIIKYLTCCIKQDTMRAIFTHMQRDWNELTCNNQRNIMRKVNEEGWQFTRLYTRLAALVAISICIIFNAPFFLDLVLPQNELGQKLMSLKLEYFVDNDKYYHFILLHMQLSLLLSVVTITATDVTYIFIIFHACGLHAVAGYRYEHIFDGMEDLSDVDKEIVVRRRIAAAVEYHNNALQFNEDIQSCYRVSYVLQRCVCVISISGVLYNLRQGIEHGNVTVTVLFSIDLFCHYGTVFLIILPSEKLLDTMADCFYNIWNGYWYEAPLKTRKELLILLQNTADLQFLSFFGVCNMTFEAFNKVIKVSFSYFTVISTVQQ